MNKILLTALTLVLAIGAATVVLAASGGSDPAVTTTGATRAVEDVSGPCDEAEHAADPRCTGGRDGAAAGEAAAGREHPEDDATAAQAPAEVAEDVSGPCDEAEHAADPECAGPSDTRGPSANAGPGSVTSGSDDATEVEDHSGSDDGESSGPGGDDD